MLEVLYFLPSIVCLLWFVSFALKVKTTRQVLFMWIQCLNTFLFATYALYMTPHDDYSCMIVMNSINIPLCLTLLPIVVVFSHMLHSDIKPKLWHLLLFLPAVILGTIANMSHYVLGMDNSERMAKLHDLGVVLAHYNTPLCQLHDFVVYDLFAICCLMFLIIISLECIMVLRKEHYHPIYTLHFLFGKKKTTPTRAVAVLYLLQIVFMLPLVVMGRPFMIAHGIIGALSMIAIAVVKHCTCHIVFYSEMNDCVSLYQLSHLRPAVQQDTTEPLLPDGATNKSDIVATQFAHLMENERIYLDEDLTLSTVCNRMGMGRTTISNMISNHYGIPFRDVVNKYRIQAVKDYLLTHPTATQETVASECGFKNAPSLNRKFKEIEGTTPLMWLTLQCKKQ